MPRHDEQYSQREEKKSPPYSIITETPSARNHPDLMEDYSFLLTDPWQASQMPVSTLAHPAHSRSLSAIPLNMQSDYCDENPSWQQRRDASKTASPKKKQLCMPTTPTPNLNLGMGVDRILSKFGPTLASSAKMAASHDSPTSIVTHTFEVPPPAPLCSITGDVEAKDVHSSEQPKQNQSVYLDHALKNEDHFSGTKYEVAYSGVEESRAQLKSNRSPPLSRVSKRKEYFDETVYDLGYFTMW